MQKGYYLVLATAIISGFSIFLNKWAVDGLNPYVFTFSKNVLVAVFLFSMLLAMREWKSLFELSGKRWAQLVAIGLVGGSIPFLLFFKGLQMSNAGGAAFIHKTMFVFVAILAAVFLKERLSWAYALGGLLLLAGNGLLLKVTGSFDMGSWLILGATMLWAVENTLSKHVLAEVSSRVVAWARMFFGSLFIFLFLVATGNIQSVASFTVPQFEWVLFTSILLLLYVATWYEGLRTVPVSVAACILLLGSVITTTLQLLFLDKVLTIAQGVGMALIVVGVVVVVWRRVWRVPVTA